MGILNAIRCALIEFVNMFIEHVLDNILNVIAFIVGLLPPMPLPDVRLEWGEFGQAVGYFVPVSTLIGHFALFLAIYGIWTSYEYIMRLIKLIK